MHSSVCVACVLSLGLSACALDSLGLARDELDSGSPDAALPTDSGQLVDADVIDGGSVDDGGRLVDAQADAGSVDLLDFGPPVLVEELSEPGASDDDPSLTEDLLEIFFNSDRGGFHDIYTSRRANVDDPWDPPARVAELSSSSFDTTPFIASGGRTIWLASERSGRSNEIFVSTRPNRSSAWDAPRLLPALNTGSSDASPATRDLLRIVFDSNRGGTYDMYQAVRPMMTGAWGTPALLPGLATSDHNVNPVLDMSGLRLWFSSNRAGSEGPDIWMTRRVTLDGPFESPARVAVVSSSGVDDDPWISLDLRQLYFASDRAGSSDIYVAVR